MTSSYGLIKLQKKKWETSSICNHLDSFFSKYLLSAYYALCSIESGRLHQWNKKKKDWSLLPRYSHSRGSITKLIKMRQKSVPGKGNAFIKMQR